MAEVETGTNGTDERELALTKPAGSLLDRWLHDERGGEHALVMVDRMVAMLQKLRVASIGATYPSDWVVHVARDGDGNILSQRAFLQDIGADRAGKVWGIEVAQPIIEREDFEDGTYAYHMLADGWSKTTGERVENAEGSRWSGQKFFERQKSADNKIDPVYVRKAAFANLHGRIVRALGGLGGVPVEELKRAGLDVARCVYVDYGKGSKGGESTGATTGDAEFRIAYGKDKGKALPELSDQQLQFYRGRTQAELGDPAKAKYSKKNERELALFDAEIARRTAAAQRPAGDDDAPIAKPDRGARQTKLFKRLSGHDVKIGDLLNTLVPGAHSLTELTEAQLTELEAKTDDDFRNAAAALGEKED